MTKAELRQEFLIKRRELTVDDVTNRSHLIAQHFIDFFQTSKLISQASLIHIFLPIQRQHEVDTWPIIRSVWAQFSQTQFAVPVTNAADNQLTHYPLYPSTLLRNNRWGIPEPVADGQLPIDSRQIDAVLIPLLVFDKRGHRVGYGGGYYDRFLADCRPDCLKIGLSLVDPIEQIPDLEITDIPLDSCITPHTLYSFD